MDVVIHAMGLPFNGETIKTKSLGGSESAAYYLAKELASRGHNVKVFTSSQEEGKWDDVTYIWHGPSTEKAPLGERFCHYAENTQHDLLVIQRHPLAFHRDYAAKVTVWQLHDLALYRTQRVINGGIPRINAITTVSEWHKEQVHKVWGVNKDSIKVVHNGVDAVLYDETRKDKERCEKAQFVKEHKGFRMLYQSRPERGLIHLLRPGGIMSRLYEFDQNAHLFICGYDNVTEDMAPLYQQLAQFGNALPNVTHLGALSKRELAEVQMSCDLLCYPTDFEEVSCITAMEAMHAHLPMLTSECAALPETCNGSGTILLPLKDGSVDEDAFVDAIKDLILDLDSETRAQPSKIGVMAEKQRAASRHKTWAKATDELIAIVDEQYSKATPQQLVRHYIEHSDILAAEHLLAETPVSNDLILEASRKEIETMYEFSRDSEKNRAHYDHFEAEAIENVGGEDAIVNGKNGFTTQTRFIGILNLAKDAISNGARKILDFGSSYGHISIPIAREFPYVEVTGVDHVAQSVRLANMQAEKAGVTNAKYVQGTIGSVPAVDGGYDIIIAAEVIEHIRDYIGALEYLRSLLSKDGLLIVTTPTGRWEWSGHKAFKTGREHLSHFDRIDLKEICGDMEMKMMCAPAGTDQTAAPLGSLVYSIKPEDKPFRAINYATKHKRQNPRQTLSLCMIVRNGESELRKAVNSIIDYVDEVVIRVDPTTDDGTIGVIDRLKAEHPHKPFNVDYGLAPLKDGFDAARNVTVEAASGDWVFWMDADEECVGASNLWRLLRPSGANAYAIQQHHYSAVPAQLLSTDYPARLFRNKRGTRFYGLVHEHPEDIVGEAIYHTQMVSDVSLMHVGYVDEPVRRKRFLRNFDLLARDVEKNPDRILNKMLMLRDTAQMIIFEQENGRPFNPNQAHYGISLFEELLEKAHSRMVIDAMQYYSLCVSKLGYGFEAQVNIGTKKPRTEEPYVAHEVKGRFHNKDVYFKLMDKLMKESVDNFDSPYF